MPQNMRFFERQKFMWDGEEYDSLAAAEAKKKHYEDRGFDTQVVDQEGRFFLYTRRVVKVVVVEGEPPPV